MKKLIKNLDVLSPKKSVKKLNSPYSVSVTYLYLPYTLKTCVLPYHPPAFPSQKKLSPPPLIVIDEEEEWEVEEVLDSRVKRGNLKYLVHWKGYTKEDDSWELSDNLKNSKKVVSDFHKTHPAAPRPLDARNVLNFIPIENYTEIPKGEQNVLYNWEDSKMYG